MQLKLVCSFASEEIGKCVFVTLIVRRLAMKGNALLLSTLLLVSGAAYAMDQGAGDGVNTTITDVTPPKDVTPPQPDIQPQSSVEMPQPGGSSLIEPSEAGEKTEAVQESAQAVEEAVQEAAQGIRARFGAAWSWVTGKATGAKDKVVSAWHSKPTISDLKNKIPSWQDVKGACTYRNIKTQIRNLPTTINNHRLATAIIVGTPIAMVVGWKLWQAYKASQKKPVARYRVIN